MDESERRKKLKAGKEKFTQYLKRKEEIKNAKEKEKKDEVCQLSAGESPAVNEATTSTSSDSSGDINVQIGIFDDDDDDLLMEMGISTVVPDVLKLESACSPFELQSNPKCDTLISENTSAFETTQESRNDFEDDVFKFSGDIRARLDEDINRIQEYETTLRKRDDIISKLSTCLKVTIEERDTLQIESTKQAAILENEIEILKLQIQNATEFLKNQKSKNGVSAADLLATSNQLIVLEKSCAEKNNTIESLNRQNASLNDNLEKLRLDFNSTASNCDAAHDEIKVKQNEIEMLQSENHQLRESVQTMTSKYDYVNEELRLKEEMLVKSKCELETVESEILNLKNRELISTEEMNKLREFCRQQQTALDEKVKESEDLLCNLQSKLKLSEELLEEVKTKAAQDVQELNDHLRELHMNSNHLVLQQQNDNENSQMMLNELKMSHQLEVSSLKEKILTVNLELEHLKIKMNETESFDSFPDLEKLKSEIRDKNETIDRYSEEIKVKDDAILNYLRAQDNFKIKLDETISEKMNIEMSLTEKEELVRQLKLENVNLKDLEASLNQEKQNILKELEDKKLVISQIEKQLNDTFNKEELVRQLELENANLKNLEASLHQEKQVILEELKDKNLTIIQIEKQLNDTSNKEELVRQLELENANLKNLEASLHQEKQIILEELEVKKLTISQIEKQLNDNSEELLRLKLLYDTVVLEKADIETNLKDKDVMFAGRWETLEQELNEERLKGQQYKLELQNYNESNQQIKQQFSDQSEQLCHLQSLLALLTEEKAMVEEKLKLSDDKLRQLEKENLILAEAEQQMKHEKQMFDNYKTEIENHLKDNISILEEVKFKNFELENVKKELENEKSILETFKKQVSEANEEREILQQENDNQTKTIEELKALLSNAVKSEEVSSKFICLSREFEQLKADGAETYKELASWKEKYNSLLEEKMKLDIETHTSELDTGITRQVAYMCGLGDDSVANTYSELSNVANFNDKYTNFDNISEIAGDSYIQKLVAILDELLTQFEATNCNMNPEFICRELHALRDGLVKIENMSVVRDELENVDEQNRKESIRVKYVRSETENDSCTVDEMDITLGDPMNDRRQFSQDINDKFSNLISNASSGFQEKSDLISCEAQVNLDSDEWKCKYDQLLEEKTELELELNAIKFGSGITQSCLNIEKLDDSYLEEEESQLRLPADEESTTAITNVIDFTTHVDELVNRINSILIKVKGTSDLKLSFIFNELKFLRERLRSLSRIEVLQKELECTIAKEEIENIKVKHVVPLGFDNKDVERIDKLKLLLDEAVRDKLQILADYNKLQTDFEQFKQFNMSSFSGKSFESASAQFNLIEWEEKYNTVLQEKIKLEFELQTAQNESDIIQGKKQIIESRSAIEKSSVVSAKCDSRVNVLIKMIDQLLHRVNNEMPFDIKEILGELHSIREHCESLLNLNNLQNELENAIAQEEAKVINVKKFQLIGGDGLETNSEQSTQVQLQLEKLIAENTELRKKVEYLKETVSSVQKYANSTGVQTDLDLDDEINWKEKYDQLLQEKVELEVELQTNTIDTNITSKSAYMCGEKENNDVNIEESKIEIPDSDLVNLVCAKFESYKNDLLKPLNQLLATTELETSDLQFVMHELRDFRESLVKMNGFTSLKEDLENLVYQRDTKDLVTNVPSLGFENADDKLLDESITLGSESADKATENILEIENLKLRQKITYLENQLVEKDNDIVHIKEELQAQYEEDVEHVRQCLETSLAQESQAVVEAEVDELKEKVDADIRARNMENMRLCNALQELKVQVQQLQRDKQKMEQSLGSGGILQLDDVQTEFYDEQNSFLALGELSKNTGWEVMSENSDDLKVSNDNASKLLSYLLEVYVKVGKTVNKELINLIGTDLDFCDMTVAGDRSIQFPEWMDSEDIGEADASFLTVATNESANDNAYENLVLETGSKLTTAVQRLLGILAALVQRMQETQRSSSTLNEDAQIPLDDGQEDLEAQLTVAARTKEYLGVELNKASDLLKVAEIEKRNLKEELARKEKQLAEMVCQLEESRAQSQKLEECLVGDDFHYPLHQEFVGEGLRELPQIMHSVPVENQSSQLAADDAELLDENVRLQREKRGLQHRVERERSELTARIRELEQLLEETSAAQDLQMEVKRQEIADLQQQIDALEKQLRGYKNFIEEQTLEREQEREDFQRELIKLQDLTREKDRAQNSEERLSREVETWQEQLKEKNALYKQLFEKKEQLEKELEIMLEKCNSDQDVIRDLERQLDCKSRNEKILTERVSKIQSELSQTSRVHHDQSLEIEQLRKMSIASPLSVSTVFFEEYFGRGHFDVDNPPSPEAVVLELRSQVQNLEEKVNRHSLDLEGLLVVTSCLSSPCSEEVSVREQLEVLRDKEKEERFKNESVDPSFGAFLKDIRRLEDKVESLTRSKDIVMKRFKDYEAQIVKLRHVEDELLQDRDILQQKVNAQLLQITSLQSRIEKRRFGFEDDEFTERISELQEELVKERLLTENKTKLVEELQEGINDLEQQCNSYKKQIADLMQQYNDDVNLHKKAQTANNVELNEAKHKSEMLQNDLLKTQRQLEDVSSLLQSIMMEKNKEIDMLSNETQLLKSENEEFKCLQNDLEVKLSILTEVQQELAAAKESKEKLTDDLLAKDTKLNEAEKEYKKCLGIIEQKRREVEALKVVLEEKAQLVEQVATLRAELVDLTQYQARLQEDFDTVQTMLEEKHLELAFSHQEVSELNIVKDTFEKEKAVMQNQIDLLRQKVHIAKANFEVQVEIGDEEKDKLNDQNLKIISLQSELSELKAEKEDLVEKLKSEEKKVKALNKKLKLFKTKLDDSEENVKALNVELDKSKSELKDTKDELNQILQQKSRLEAEIALRDTKIFRIEDELDQFKSSKSDLDGNSGKASLYKFLEEVRQEVMRESANYAHNEKDEDVFDGSLEPLKSDDRRTSFLRDDVRSGVSPGTSVSGSDVESVGSETLPAPVRSLMRKVYKEAINVLNLSELDAVEEQVPTDAPMQEWDKSMKQKNWENEKVHLISEIEALKELLTHATSIVATSKPADTQMSTISELLNSIFKLLLNDRSVIFEKLLDGFKSSTKENDLLEKSVSDLLEMYNNLTHTVQNLALSLKRGVSNQYDTNSTAWEVQMAIAKERLLNQNEQKKLLNQLKTLDQQLLSRERQLSRQADLLQFRIQQEEWISEDLRRNLELEKSRCIELCSQLALEKGRATHLDLNIIQLKTDLSAAQMVVEQEKQEFYTIMQQLKNEKATVESFAQILQTERENFIQLQEAMEAEKRRSKSSCLRDQQIKEELRQALIAERDRQLELTSLLEAERVALQNARYDLLRMQNKTSPVKVDSQVLLSPHGSVDDIHNTLTVERVKSQDLSAALQKEQHKVSVLTAALQQDRKQLLDELESVKENCAFLQTKLENQEAQRANLTREVNRHREEVHRLELECDKFCNELSNSQTTLYQKDQEIEQLRRIQREMNKDMEIERELDRQKLQDMKLEVSKLQQKISSLEKEKELIERSEHLMEKDFAYVPQQQNRKLSLPPMRNETESSRIQQINLETLRQKILLLLLKQRDNVNQNSNDLANPDVVKHFSATTNSLLEEIENLSQELQLPLQSEEGVNVQLNLMEKIVRNNAELAAFALSISEEKLTLRDSLMHEKNELDSFKWSQVAAGVSSMSSNASILSAERASWTQERTLLQQALHKAESDLVRASLKQPRFNSPSLIDNSDDNRVIWQKYLKAESFRKNLVFQKTYLLLVLSGYQYTESGTLEMLSRMGCISNSHSKVGTEYRRSRAFQKFRSVARLMGAIFRMKYLVRRWRKYDGLHGYQTPLFDNSHDRFSTTLSTSYPSSCHSQSQRVYYSGITPVKDSPKFLINEEKSSRKTPFKSTSLSSSGSSNVSVNGRLSEYVRRFDNIQQQLGILAKESDTKQT